MTQDKKTTKKIEALTYTIDATGMKLGRLASDIAKKLMGKESADFERHILADVHVQVLNASKLDIDKKKLEQKNYMRYTGYPGGLKKRNLSESIAKFGHKDSINHAVRGMLPRNTHRDRLMRRLNITE